MITSSRSIVNRPCPGGQIAERCSTNFSFLHAVSPLLETFANTRCLIVAYCPTMSYARQTLATRFFQTERSSTWGLMLSLFPSEAAADVGAEDVLVRSGYYVICCLRRQASEIIFSARFVQEFVDICVQDVSRDTRRTLDLRRFSAVLPRLSYICIMTQGFIDAGWAIVETELPDADVARMKRH